MKTMTQKPELKEGQVRAAEIVELNTNEVQAVSGGGGIRSIATVYRYYRLLGIRNGRWW